MFRWTEEGNSVLMEQDLKWRWLARRIHGVGVTSNTQRKVMRRNIRSSGLSAWYHTLQRLSREYLTDVYILRWKRIGRTVWLQEGKVTRDVIGLIRTIGERYVEKDKDVYAVFVDLGKAFDKVDWKKLMGILKKIGVDWKERKLLSNLYMKQRRKVRTGE